MRSFGAVFAGLYCSIALSGCSTNTSIANITSGAPAKLVMAVGTINDSAGTLGTGAVSLNAVTSFRNTLGNSAYENPGQFSLTGPGGSVIASQPGVACDQLFSYGLFPGCVTTMPLGAPIGGAPPTYNPPNPNGEYSIGFIPSGQAAAAGMYTVNTTVAVNGTNVKYSATATLPASPTVLGNEPAPTFVSDGAGGGTFTIGTPAGVTESLIVVESDPAAPPQTVAATIETKNAAAALPAGTLTVGNNYQAFVIGADYGLVEDGPPANTQAAPTLAGGGSGGASDITVSGFLDFTE
jgi:hypothetical protein